MLPRGVLFWMLFLSVTFPSCGGATQESIQPEEPVKVVSLCPVAPDLIGVTIRAGRVEHARQIPYQKERADIVRSDELRIAWVFRAGRRIGALIGDGSKLLALDRLVGEKLDTALADRPETYSIRSSEDQDYADGSPPANVFRKSKPTDLARTGADFEAPLEHTLYLKLVRPLKAGKKYVLAFKMNGMPEQAIVYDPVSMRSEAVHVSHIGFRPDDPSKVAFLSLWMGSGGPVDFQDRKRFFLLEEKTGARVFEGEVKLSKRADNSHEDDASNRNFSKTDVYIMDFSTFRKPGAYRVCVGQVGCSYPFEIANDVWQKAFYVSARGLYHQRSGIEIGPPYTTFKRPRNFYPGDGVKVYTSKATLMETSNGLGGSVDNFGPLLLAGKTAEALPDAWGGYCDAGDWDRRIQHLDIARLLFDLADRFPAYFETTSLNIPKTNPKLPDVMNEAMWGVEFFRRLQIPDGGVRGGIESEGHPRYGETSWQDSQAVMAYAPDLWSTYLYAGVAARAAFVAGKLDKSLPAQYIESAIRAMKWAEKEFGARPPSSFRQEVRDARNLAAAELFRATGGKNWHDLFLSSTALRDPGAPLRKHQSHDQNEGAWVYVNTERPGMDPAVKKNCRNALISDAEMRIFAQMKTGFRLAKDPWRPAFGGAFTVPDCVPLIRAHMITGDQRYLEAAVLSAQTGAGANPLNMSYTTGVGHTYPRNVMHMDSRYTGQACPPGITVEGPLDVDLMGGWQNPLHMYTGRFCYPHVKEWPTIENYWDVFWYPTMCEFTVFQSIAPNAYVWGYLAARK